jgi:uncharacterized protein YjbJ (UPF0337 family)
VAETTGYSAGERGSPFRGRAGGAQPNHQTKSDQLDIEEIHMGLVDDAKNKAQEVKGKTKEATGKATKDRSMEAEGKGDKAKGNLKQAGENVKDAIGKK